MRLQSAPRAVSATKAGENNVYLRVSVTSMRLPVASLLLPARLREPVEVIYRFARGADAIADEGDDPPGVRLEKLKDYRRRLQAPSEVAEIIRQHQLPVGLFEDLLDAFTQDVTRKRYADFAEVGYCRARQTRSPGCCCICSNDV